MARRTISRLEKRKEGEAAEKLGKKTTKKKAASTRKKTTAKKTKKKKASKRTKSEERRRLVWAIYNGNMKEEARFPYDQRKQAEQKLDQLKSKGKRLYFIQPMKEVIVDTPPDEADAAADEAAAQTTPAPDKATEFEEAETDETDQIEDGDEFEEDDVIDGSVDDE